MREFFHPFRRKFGAFVLAVACGFMAGWIRSHTINDWIAIASFGRILRIESIAGSVLLVHAFDPPPINDPSIWWDSDFIKSMDLDGVDDESIVSIPYWSIVPPLTLLSAWLLFSTPQKRLKSARNVSTVPSA